MIENQRMTLVMANMDPTAIPDDFELNTKISERSRESIMFEEDLAAAILASRGGFERSMSVAEDAPVVAAAAAGQAQVEAPAVVDNNAEEEKKAPVEEVSTTRKIKNKFVKFFKSDIGNWISAGVNGIAGPPVAVMGKVTDEITNVIDGSDSEEDHEEQLRQIR